MQDLVNGEVLSAPSKLRDSHNPGSSLMEEMVGQGSPLSSAEMAFTPEVTVN